MKLYASLKNNKGKKDGFGGDGAIQIDLSFKNQIVGRLGLYAVTGWQGTQLLGYRVVWQSDDTPTQGSIIKEKCDYGLMNKAKATDKIEPWYCKECKTTHTTAQSKDGEVWLCEIPF